MSYQIIKTEDGKWHALKRISLKESLREVNAFRLSDFVNIMSQWHEGPLPDPENGPYLETDPSDPEKTRLIQPMVTCENASKFDAEYVILHVTPENNCRIDEGWCRIGEQFVFEGNSYQAWAKYTRSSSWGGELIDDLLKVWIDLPGDAGFWEIEPREDANLRMVIHKNGTFTISKTGYKDGSPRFTERTYSATCKYCLEKLY